MTPLPPLLPLAEAKAQMCAAVTPITSTEQVPLSEACGRILAAPLKARIDVPPGDNSAMDGYALNSADLARLPQDADGMVQMPISAALNAGAPPQSLQPKSVAQIMTGALIPSGADTVIEQERVERLGETCRLPANWPSGRHIRRAGEDITSGETVLPRGQKLRPQDIGLAASLGIPQLTVFRRLKVAIFSTGDELIEPGTPQSAGQIYNSNRYQLQTLLTSLGCEVIDLGTVPDALSSTMDTLQQAAQTGDLILTSGGVSVGARDYLGEALDKTGKTSLWRINIKPGKPVRFGHVFKARSTAAPLSSPHEKQGKGPTAPFNKTPFIGLPGNPVSVFVTFLILVRPVIGKMQGRAPTPDRPQKVRAGFAIETPRKRREFLRCRLELDSDGMGLALPYPHQGSGVLTSASRSDGLCEIPGQTTVRKGDWVDFFSYDALLA